MEQCKQLAMDFDNECITDQNIEEVDNRYKKCKHSVMFKSLKEDYVTYCKRCGSILSVKHKEFKEVK